jgi:hypothetical protein
LKLASGGVGALLWWVVANVLVGPWVSSGLVGWRVAAWLFCRVEAQQTCGAEAWWASVYLIYLKFFF